MDLSFLDQPEILEVIFPLVYSPFLTDYLSLSSSGVPGYSIEVADGVKISAEFWARGREAPSILYFHGNGETAAGYGDVAPLYNERGMNLFVADYRGYGGSNGKPTITNLIGDAHPIFQGFKKILSDQGYKDSLFVMGRSLGSMPAIEVAVSYQDEVRGLIIESGAANNFRRLWDYLSPDKKAMLGEESPFLNKVKIRQVRKPTLIIHGEYDQVISVAEGKELYRNSAASDRRILVIPGADHNDIMIRAPGRYFDTLAEFVKAYG